MKYIRGLFVLCLVLAMVGMPSPAAAQAYTYTSGIQLQNLSSDEALVTIYYYSQQTDTNGTVGGSQVSSADATILGLGTKTFFPIDAPTGFKGSVVIASSTPLASVANLMAAGIGNASYVGFSGGAQSVNLPLLMKNNSGFSTWFSIQNTDSSNNATVYVDYSDSGAGNDVGPIIIQPNASYIINQSVESHASAVFAGTLTSNRPVAVVVVQEGTGAMKTILASAGFSASATDALMPLVHENNSGYNTGVQIQNAGGSPTNITVSYTAIPGNGTSCTETYTDIQPGESKTFALYAFAGVARTGMTTTCVKDRFVGAAHITSNSANMPVVAIVNQTSRTVAGAYDAFLPSQATDKVIMPLIMDRNSNWNTGFNVANVGANPVTVTCTFTNAAYTVSADLGPGEALNDIQRGKIADKYVGSGTCVATGTGEKLIVGMVNEINPAAGDNLLVYEAINVASVP